MGDLPSDASQPPVGGWRDGRLESVEQLGRRKQRAGRQDPGLCGVENVAHEPNGRVVGAMVLRECHYPRSENPDSGAIHPPEEQGNLIKLLPE